MAGKRFLGGFSKEVQSVKGGSVRMLIEGLCSTRGTEEWLLMSDLLRFQLSCTQGFGIKRKVQNAWTSASSLKI